jgi:molybdate transport system regulatory protein
MFRARSKVWIEDDQGEMVLGTGRLKMLETIRELGSIQAAAKQLKMSYRAVWARIKATEARLGAPLLVRSVGGSCGGGSQLTPFALALMDEFRRLHKAVRDHADEAFDHGLKKTLTEAARSRKDRTEEA